MNIIVCGYGRAGKALIEQISISSEHELIGVICRDESEKKGKDIGTIIRDDRHEMGISITPISKAESEFSGKKIDVVIDFSNRAMAMSLLELCGKIKSNLVICTTNHTLEEVGRFEQMAEQEGVGVVYAPNLTLGINLLLDFAKTMSNVLNDFQYEVIEMHPSNKPKPTATARIITEAINKESIPIHSVRMEGYIGFHELIATDGVERITIRHESLSRAAFAKGALIAAKFIRGKIGLFFMRDVIKELSLAVQDETHY